MVAVAFEVPPAGGALVIVLDTGGEAPGAEDVAAEGGHHPSGGFQHAGLGVETHRAGDLARRGGRGGDSTADGGEMAGLEEEGSGESVKSTVTSWSLSLGGVTTEAVKILAAVGSLLVL